MKSLKHTLIISSYVLLVALFFAGGFALGQINTENKAMPAAAETPYVTETVADYNDEKPSYRLVIEDSVLKIYRQTSEGDTLLKSEKIVESIFPDEDIKTLKEGVEFERLDEARQIFEDFVS